MRKLITDEIPGEGGEDTVWWPGRQGEPKGEAVYPPGAEGLQARQAGGEGGGGARGEGEEGGEGGTRPEAAGNGTRH